MQLNFYDNENEIEFRQKLEDYANDIISLKRASQKAEGNETLQLKIQTNLHDITKKLEQDTALFFVKNPDSTFYTKLQKESAKNKKNSTEDLKYYFLKKALKQGRRLAQKHPEVEAF